MAILDGIEAALVAQPALPPSPRPQFAGQLPFSANGRSAEALAMAPETPLDIKVGLTRPEDAAHPLRWGFMTAGRICKDMAQAILIAQVGLYPIVTFQYSSTTLYQVSYHIRYLFF